MSGEKGSQLRFLLLIVVALGVFVGPLFLRSLIEARSALVSAEREHRGGSSEQRIWHLHHSMKWYFPGNRYAKAAKVQLEQLMSDSSLEAPLSLAAHEAYYQALMSTRNVLTGTDHERLRSLRETIVSLRAPGGFSGTPIREQQDFRRSEGFQLLAQLGFWLYVFSVTLLIWRGFSSAGKLQKHPARRFALLAGIGLGLWLIGLSVA